jgi:hypothetical protein
MMGIQFTCQQKHLIGFDYIKYYINFPSAQLINHIFLKFR